MRAILAISLVAAATTSAGSEPISPLDAPQTLRRAINAPEPLSPQRYSLTGEQPELVTPYSLGEVAERFARDNADKDTQAFRAE